MKKKLLLSLLAAGLCSTPAMAQNYVTGSLGLGSLGNSEIKFTNGLAVKDGVQYKSGVPFGIAVGTKLDEYRVEGAILSQSHTIDKITNGIALYPATNSDTSVLSFMANGYRDFEIKDAAYTPYVTAGIGIAKVKATVNATDEVDKSVFAWQLGAGVGIKAADSLVVDFGVRYLKPSDVKSKDGTSEITVSSTNFLVGARYSF